MTQFTSAALVEPDESVAEADESASTDTGARVLVDMFRYRRPHGSKTERRFIRRFLSPLGMDIDAIGNLMCRIGDARVLWSCHTDTVHRQGGFQQIAVKDDRIVLSKDEKQSNCLGADDTAGVWLMREMILAKQPGLYVFHRGEERGGIGSGFIADTTPALLQDIDMAIALDRMGYDSVITHQAYGRCCSDEFGKSLIGALNGGFRLDRGGTFTDTANYTNLVPECTNLSVGYDHQHFESESLDYEHLFAMRDFLTTIDTDKLVVKRDPTKVEYEFDDRHWGKSMGFAGYQGSKKDGKPYGYSNTKPGGWPTLDDYGMDQGNPTLFNLVREYPDEIADILEQYGFDAKELASEIYKMGGVMKRWNY